jgi:hypothetical protein
VLGRTVATGPRQLVQRFRKSVSRCASWVKHELGKYTSGSAGSSIKNTKVRGDHPNYCRFSLQLIIVRSYARRYWLHSKSTVPQGMAWNMKRTYSVIAIAESGWPGTARWKPLISKAGHRCTLSLNEKPCGRTAHTAHSRYSIVSIVLSFFLADVHPCR